MDENVNVAKKKSVRRSSFRKKDCAKVHRRIHKAEREKLKRDHMNELFLELGKALGPADHNNGKSSALTDTIRILQDLIAQVDSLKKENSSLLQESQYVAVEKDELKEENSTVAAQIKKLQSQIHVTVQSQPMRTPDCSSYWDCNSVPLQPVTDDAKQAAPPVVGPLLVVPLQSNPKEYAQPLISDMVTNQLQPNVTKPRARYPSPSDSWPLDVLSEQRRAE